MDADLQRQLVEDFVVQSIEELEAFDHELLALETRDGTDETLRTIFRVIHTIKGTAGCIGLGVIERLAHSAENVLSQVQRGTVEPTAEVISALLRTSDRLNQMVRGVEQSGVDAGFDVTDLLAELEDIQAQRAAVPAPKRESAFGLFDDDDDDDDSAPAANAATPTPVSQSAIEPSADADQEPASDVFGAVSMGAPAADVAPTVRAEVTQAKARPQSKSAAAPSQQLESAKPSVADNVIRVDVAQLDTLMNLVGELVLTRNQILASTGTVDRTALNTAAQRLNVITSELQQRVMKTRMQPIGNVWAKFPRTVRDLAADLGKKVRLVMDGQATELDRTILDAIRDPLTHLVRNAIDHGLEGPSDRRARGKSDEGLLAIRAFHEGGQVNIEIMDDGRGIDVERVKAKAMSSGLIDAERAARMSEREALQLIFLPGFSTAEQITNVSGRGVGMDVVRSNVERTGGSIDVHSEPGQGTTIRLKIPLTLAIIPALIVTSAGERFAIPQMSLVELVRIERGTSAAGVEMLAGRPVYRLRGRILTLASLGEELGLTKANAAQIADAEITNIVVLQADGHEFGLIVDAVNDTEEIVVKPLGKQLKHATVYAGATIMGDGRVALILDAMGVAQRAGLVTGAKDRFDVGARAVAKADQTPTQEMLLFTVGRDRRISIPLSVTTRLEEIPLSRVETAGQQRVVQYRGQLLPLVDVAEFLGHPATDRDDDETLHIVVATFEGSDVGLIVDRIEDIVQDVIETRCNATAFGLLGSAVIGGRVTDLLDVAAVVRRLVITTSVARAA